MTSYNMYNVINASSIKQFQVEKHFAIILYMILYMKIILSHVAKENTYLAICCRIEVYNSCVSINMILRAVKDFTLLLEAQQNTFMKNIKFVLSSYSIINFCDV